MERDRISTNLESIRTRIADACARANRDPNDVTLIAVTKTVDAETTQAVIDLGVNDIAENRQQFASEKLPNVPAVNGPNPPRLHFIGPLQRNKVARVLEYFSIIHSVDSGRLAREISKRAEQTIDIFVEVNTSNEPQKGGFEPDALTDALAEIRLLPNLNIVGLMTMAARTDTPEDARPSFRTLAEIAARHNLKQLSMGMSGDFEIAIEEGATHVRIGSALFAPRE